MRGRVEPVWDDGTEMTTLEQAGGAAFDQMSLQTSTTRRDRDGPHGEDSCENPHAVAFAGQIETDQKFEKAKMDQLLGSRSPSSECT